MVVWQGESKVFSVVASVPEDDINVLGWEVSNSIKRQMAIIIANSNVEDEVMVDINCSKDSRTSRKVLCKK